MLLGPGGLVPGRGARRAEDLEPVALGDGGEPRHVRVARERRRQDASGRWLADLPEESLELHRCEPNQRLRATRLGVVLQLQIARRPQLFWLDAKRWM